MDRNELRLACLSMAKEMDLTRDAEEIVKAARVFADFVTSVSDDERRRIESLYRRDPAPAGIVHVKKTGIVG